MATQISQLWAGFQRVRDAPAVEQIGGSAHVAVALALVIGETVKLDEVVDVLGAVLVPEIMEAALLAC
jgi:hypothetical protein